MRPALRGRGGASVRAGSIGASPRGRDAAGTWRSRGDAQGRRHVGQRHPQEIVQGDDRTMSRVEAPECQVHQLAVGEVAGVVGRRGSVDGVELDFDRTPSPAPGEVEAGVHGKAMEPGIEPLRVAKPGQVSPGSNERLLDRVARELRVPEDEPGRRVQPRKPRIHEPGEGVMIALPRAFDEHSLVHVDLGVPRPVRSRPTAYWRGTAENCSLHLDVHAVESRSSLPNGPLAMRTMSGSQQRAR